MITAAEAGSVRKGVATRERERERERAAHARDRPAAEKRKEALKREITSKRRTYAQVQETR